MATTAMEAVDTSSSSSPLGSNGKLPSSPAARAFFAALDEQSSASPNSKKKNGGSSSSPTNKKKQTSDFVSKRIQTLGWRNRYSQQEQYPVSIQMMIPNNKKSNGDGNDDDDDDEKTTTCYSFTVRQVQRGELEGTYGTGATVWPASMVLLKYLERHAATLIRNKIVVDLGAGTGITSIGAALLGARHVYCTDGEEPVVQLARDNIEQVVLATAGKDKDSSSTEDRTANINTTRLLSLNGCPLDAQKYWWGTGTIHGLSSHHQDGDDDGGGGASNKNNDDVDLVVLVSDCVLPKLYPIAPLVQALDQLLSSSSSSHYSPSMAILSYEHRHYPDYDPRDKFRELATAANLQVEVISLEQHDPVYSVEDIEIWHVTRAV